MKKLTQTILYDEENSIRGNCFSAAIACLLELDEMPPTFAAYDDWMRRTQEFLKPLGFAYLDVLFADRGKWALGWLDCYHIINGMSPRGVRHSVIGFDGEMVWDVHPSRAGLLDDDGTDERRIEYGFLVYRRTKEI